MPPLPAEWLAETLLDHEVPAVFFYDSYCSFDFNMGILCDNKKSP
jgi:hypothetical protein